MLNHHSFSPLSYLSFHHLRYIFNIYNYSRFLWWSDLSKVLYFSSLSDPSQCDSNTKDFWMNMQTLTAYLKKLAEQNPSSSYYNVDIMKYQVQQTGITAWGLSSFYSDEVYLTEVVCWSFSCHLLDARLTTGSIHCQQGHTLYQEMESPALWGLVQLTDPDPVSFFWQKCKNVWQDVQFLSVTLDFLRSVVQWLFGGWRGWGRRHCWYWKFEVKSLEILTNYGKKNRVNDILPELGQAGNKISLKVKRKIKGKASIKKRLRLGEEQDRLNHVLEVLAERQW